MVVRKIVDYYYSNTVKAPNFDKDSKLRRGGGGGHKKFKNERCFMAQERHPLSKAYKSEIFFEMQKNERCLLLFVLFTFPNDDFSLWKLAFQKCILCISSKKGLLFKNLIINPPKKLSLEIMVSLESYNSPLFF